MRAAVLSPDLSKPAIAVADWPEPELRDGWVRVRVVRAALNRLDEMTVAERGDLPAPAVIGSDAAGVVTDVGPGVTSAAVGDEVVIHPTLWWGDRDDVQGPECEVLGYPTQGTHAELVTVPAENVFPKPRRLSWDEAAALPLAGVTAWRAVVSRGGLRAGETMVVTAASSGVGSFAIQIGAALGARVVAVTSSEEKAEQALFLGAGTVVLRGTASFERDLREQVGAAGADLVVQPTGTGWQAAMAALRPGGRMVVVGRKGADVGTVPVQVLYWRQLQVLGSSLGSPRDFAALLHHVEQATWTPVVDSVYDLEHAPEAYARLDSEQRFGKVILAPLS